MKHVALLAAVSLAAVSSAAIAKPKSVPLKEVKEPVSFSQTERDYDGTFSSRPAVQRVRVPGGLFVSRPQNDMAPDPLLAKHVEIDIRSDLPTLADLQTLLDVQGVSITIDWRSLEEGSADSARVGSFTAASRYQGVANSVNGGSGVQQNGLGGGLGGIGGVNGGFGGVNGGIGGVNGGLNGGVGGVNGGLNGGVGGVNGGLNGGIGGVNGGVGGLNGGLGGGFGGGQNVVIPGASQEEVADQFGGRAANNGVAGGGEGEDGRSVTNFFDRALPFRYFKGTVGELIRRLENSGNIAVWYDGGLIVGDVRRYSVAVMQNRDIVQSVVNELLRLGARDVVGSVGAGQIFYSAPPRTNGEIIEPYLRRLQGNLSEVTLQVALVTVSMSKNAEAGFDWSALNFGYGSNVTTDESGNGNGTGEGTGTGGVTVGANSGLGSGVFTLNNNAFNANLGDIFGTGKILSVAGAIKFLSRIGNTSVAQNVEMRTLSGSPVILRSGESIPFVQNVGATLAGGIGGGALGSSQTAAIGTGLTLNVDPRYDSTSGIVTMDVGLRLVDLVEFVQLNAGAQLGTLTQPRTREQGINSILRLEAGQTAILGGIRRDLSSDARTGPFGAFSIGSRNRNREVFWLFAIVRPVVTVYETADAPTPARSVLDTRTMINPRSDGTYGAAGRPGETVPVYGNTQTPGSQGTPTYYVEPGAVTPANRVPSGVVVSAPPAPRDVMVPGAATPVEVNSGLPSGAVLRDPVVAPSGQVAPAYSTGPSVRYQAEPVAPAMAPAPRGEPAPSQIQRVELPESKPSNPVVVSPAPAPEKKSFIRPMTESEKGNN